MRIAVTGARGQVARALAEVAPWHGIELIAIGRPTLDLTKPASIEPALAAVRPAAILHAAAYTAVDKAESEPDLAFAVNAEGARAVAAAARRLGVPLIYLSTDYVFDGAAARPYREDDAARPLNVYGGSKLAGEQAVAAETGDHVILRTGWVYGAFGANFAKTMLRLAMARQEIAVVADQHGAPTAASDLAEAILQVFQRLLASRGNAPLKGTFHLTARGQASRAEFAQAIFTASAREGGPSARVVSIATAQYPTPARRPANSRLDCGKLAAAYGIALPEWQNSLPRAIARLLREG